MEEKLIRGRPARVLSDGTVEAETDEGWMRFENLEHLEEYLDAMSPAKSLNAERILRASGPAAADRRGASSPAAPGCGRAI